MNEETDNQIDPSVIDDMPASVKRSLAEFINKRGGNIPVPEKKNTGVTNTKILRAVTNNLVRIQGQLTTIDNRLAQQNALIKSNLVTSVGMINAIEQRDNDLAQKFDELTAAFEAQSAFMEQQADLAEDKEAEARLEEQLPSAFTEGFDLRNTPFLTSPFGKYILRTIGKILDIGIGTSGYRKGFRVGQLARGITQSRLGLRLLGGKGQVLASKIGGAGKSLLRGPKANVAKGLITRALVKTAPYTIGLGLDAYNLVQKGRVFASRALKDSLKSDLPKVLGPELGTQTARQITKEVVPEIASATLQKASAKQILETGGKKIAKKGASTAAKSLGRAGFDRGASAVGKSITQQLYEKSLKKGAAGAAPDLMVRNLATSGNPLQRALASPKVQRMIIQKVGQKKAAAFTAKAASKAVPLLGTAIGGIEGIARGLMGDWKGMALSFGGAVPFAGIGFAAIDILRDIDRDAYEAHIEPNFPIPSEENFGMFFADALGVTPDQYETGGLTKPGRAILHGTELVMDKDADPYQIFYRPVIRSLIGASTEYIQQAGPSASFIAPMFGQEVNKLSSEFGMERVNVVVPGGGSLKGSGQRLDNFERKAQQEKEYYGPAGGPKGEDGEPQAQNGGLLGMIKRFFGFPVPEGEDRSSDFPSSTLPGAHDGGGTGPGDPNGGGKIAGDLGDHLKGMRTELPVTGQIHRHPRHPPYSMSSGHRSQSMHYSGRAIDIGGYSPSTPQTGQFPGSTGADEQAPVLREIQKWNAAHGVTPVELVHGSPTFRGYGSYREYPDSHHHHVHIAYKNGGLTYDRPHIALMGEEGEEIVIPHKPSTGVGRDLFLASSEAQSDTQVVAAIREYAPEILQYDEEGEEEQTTMMIAMLPQQQSQPTEERKVPLVLPSGGRMYGPEQTLIFQSLY
jgi:hypothetical protein